MAEESVFIGGMQTLQTLGFFKFFLPFLLFFAIIYGALQKTQVFGKDRKDIDAIIALVISLIATTTAWVIDAIQGFLPWVGFIALVIVCFLMLVAMVYGDVTELAKSTWVKGGVLIAVVIAIFALLYTILGFGTLTGGFGLADTDIAILVVAAIGIFAFYLIIKGGGPASSSKS